MSTGWIIACAVLAFAFVSVVVFSQLCKPKPVEDPKEILQNQIQKPSTVHSEPPEQLQVLNCIKERPEEPGTFEHVIYFTLQDSADYFRFEINGMQIGAGSFDELDVRYAPPFRRVVFVTTQAPELPMELQVEALSKGKVIGRGMLAMSELCYHDKA